MNLSCMRFYVALFAVCMPVISEGSLRGRSYRQSGLEATKPMQNESLGSLSAPRLRVPSSIAGTHKQRPPRVYFLFLAVNKIANFAVWDNFFKVAPAERYRALIHCKGAICKLFAAKTKPLRLIPSVDSSYCYDLVSPMNQLLAAALKDDPHSANPGDKFVFVSDSTLPAKPFWNIYNTLISRRGSDFCVFPSKDWADVPVTVLTKPDRMPSSAHEVAIKTHQWMVLSRTHSERSVKLWNQGTMKDMMGNFQLNQGTLWQDPGNRTFGDTRNFGCLDEFWHMYVLFGPWTITDAKENAEYHYNDLTNAPLRINADAGWQGACDTFALWSEYTTAAVEVPHDASKSSVSPWVKLYSALDKASIPHVSNSRPAWWDSISREGIKAIRNSDFLFVRKIQDNPRLAFGGDFAMEYARIVVTG